MNKLILVPVAALVFGCGGPVEVDTTASSASTTHVQLETFQIPEMVPNTTRSDIEGVQGSSGDLRRHANSISATINTHDLPAGVYTFWWHLTHPDGEVSILWAGNDTVTNAAGSSNLQTVLPEGEANAPGAIFIGHGLQPGTAGSVVAQLWVRTHGAPSSDPVVLDEQLSTPFGRCTDSRNPTPRAGDYPCWNPQRALF